MTTLALIGTQNQTRAKVLKTRFVSSKPRQTRRHFIATPDRPILLPVKGPVHPPDASLAKVDVVAWNAQWELYLDFQTLLHGHSTDWDLSQCVKLCSDL